MKEAWRSTGFIMAKVSTSSGLGFYATKALASKGAQCVITVRNVEKGEAVKADLEAKLKEEGTATKPIAAARCEHGPDYVPHKTDNVCDIRTQPV